MRRLTCDICGNYGDHAELRVDYETYQSIGDRGVLCKSCDKALVLFDQKVGRLKKAVEYMEYHNARV